MITILRFVQIKPYGVGVGVGMNLYGHYWVEGSILNSMPGFPQEYQYLTQNVSFIIAGSGNYHYFIRKDGTTFSLMEYVFKPISSS